MFVESRALEYRHIPAANGAPAMIANGHIAAGAAMPSTSRVIDVLINGAQHSAEMKKFCAHIADQFKAVARIRVGKHAVSRVRGAIRS